MPSRLPLSASLLIGSTAFIVRLTNAFQVTGITVQKCTDRFSIMSRQVVRCGMYICKIVFRQDVRTVNTVVNLCAWVNSGHLFFWYLFVCWMIILISRSVGCYGDFEVAPYRFGAVKLETRAL